MLKTYEEEKKVFVATPAFVSTSDAVVWIIEAVTAEKNVAIVVMSKFLDGLDFCTRMIFSIPCEAIYVWAPKFLEIYTCFTFLVEMGNWLCQRFDGFLNPVVKQNLYASPRRTVIYAWRYTQL